MVIILVAVVGGLAWVMFFKPAPEKIDSPSANDPKNISYIFSGTPILLVDGVATTPVAEGSDEVQTTRYFGNALSIDLNQDGRMDEVFLVTQETEGSGVFFYLVGALNTEHGYVGSEAVFIGDRIAPQRTELGDNNLVFVQYQERAPGEPFTTEPSVAKTLRLKFDPETNQFGEVVLDFEGEANPARMTLSMHTWTWRSAQFSDGSEMLPKQSDAFTITFAEDNSFSATTDCNSAGGTYAAGEASIAFEDIFSTEMYCEGSQETEFLTLLDDARSFHFTSKGELILNLKDESGTVVFR